MSIQDKDTKTQTSTTVSSANSNQRAVGPTVDELKAKFAGRTIPLQEDFAALIDVADSGRKAFGGAPGQNPANGGYRLNSYGSYEVATTNPLQIDGGAVAIKVAAPMISSENLAIDLAQEISLVNGKLEIKTGDGLKTDSNQAITVKLAEKSGLKVNEQGVGLDDASTEVNFPAGTILPYANNTPPTGWNWCDGNEGRPDLKDYLIYSGKPAELGQVGSLPQTTETYNQVLVLKIRHIIKL